LGACTTIKGHQHFANQTHNDPGPNWNWFTYYELINNNPNTTTFTNATGIFYDSGGSGGNYLNDERNLYLVKPTGAITVTLSFTQFNLENNWDYLYVYDGNNLASPLIGKYTGTTLPGKITSTGGSVMLQFRSDCATTAAGWAASWTSKNLIGVEEEKEEPLVFSVFPNPAEEKTEVRYSLKTSGQVKFFLFDQLGRVVMGFPSNLQQAGQHFLELDIKGLSLAKGIYLLQMVFEDEMATQKLIVR